MVNYEHNAFSGKGIDIKDDKELDYYFSNAFHDMRFFIKAVTNGTDSVFTFFGDIRKDLFYISDNMKETFGFEHNIVNNMVDKWYDCIYGEKWKKIFRQDTLHGYYNKSNIHDMHYQVQDVHGNVFWIHGHVDVLWDDKKENPIFAAGRLYKQNNDFAVDPLTNFPLEQPLRQKLMDLKKYRYCCKTIGISLSHIKEINIKYGRDFGDKLIQMISQKLVENLVGKMYFYRLPGSNFFAIVDQEIEETNEELIGKLKEIIDEVYKKQGLMFDDTAKYAVIQYPREEDNQSDTVEDMIALLHMAEKENLSGYAIGSKQYIDRIYQRANMSLTLNENVLNGMENFFPVLQLIVSSDTGKIVGGETLMRWKYNDKFVSPEEFIPMLEYNNKIYEAGRWILEKAAEACSEIVKYIPEFHISVNISRKQLADEKLFELLPEILEKYHLKGENIVLEITESVLDKNPILANKLFELCKELNISVALDDFGTGYSSFKTLLQYNHSYVKIDRSFLLELEKDELNYAFLSSFTYACHNCGMKIIMEGVESENQKQLAEDLHCDLIQGYYFYKPQKFYDVYTIVKNS